MWSLMGYVWVLIERRIFEVYTITGGHNSMKLKICPSDCGFPSPFTTIYVMKGVWYLSVVR